MAERRFIERLTDAVSELREPLPTKMLGDIETKSAPQNRPNFGQNYDFNYYNSLSRFHGYGFHHDSNVNYRHEVGDLELSSLCAAVFNWTGVQLPEAPPVVMTRDAKGGLQPELNHLCADLIRRPNPYHIWADYCLPGSVSWWLDGNWYLWKVRDLSGQVIELWYVPHYLIEPRWPFDGKAPEVPLSEVEGDPGQAFISHYQYNEPGRTPILIKKSEMVHIKRGVRGSNPRKGIGAFDPVIKEIYGDDKASLFAATILKNLGIVVPIISPKDKDTTFDETTALALKEKWRMGTTGDQSGQAMINTIPVDVTKFAWNPQELDLKELRKVPESRIAAVTGIPAAMLQFMVGLEHGTSFAAYAQAREQGYESVIVPIQKAIAEQLTWQLLRTEFKGSEKAELTFDTSKVRVLQEDQNELMKRASTGYLAGILKRSWAIEMVGKESTPDDEVFFQPRSSGVIKEGEDPLAGGTSATQPGAAPAKTPKGFGSVAEIEQYLGILEKEMEGFVPK